MRNALWLAMVLAACIGLTIAGCGGGSPQGRLAISGQVTFEGQPLDQGSIQFTPLDSESGISGGAIIQNGSYTIEAEKGLAPGKYRVRIFSAEASGEAEEMPGMSEEAPKERIPAQYNVESTLEADVSGDKTTFDFKLE
jgi:hypothetical protein